MGLSIVASFVDRTEAEIAASALRSAGFNAVVMDTNFSAIDWMAMQALGGIRVGVPNSEIEEAAQFLRELIREKPQPGPDPHPGGGWRSLALILGIGGPLLLLALHEPTSWWQVVLVLISLVGLPLAWMVVAAAKSRNRQGQAVAMASTGLLLVFFALALAALTALILWLPHLLYPNGRT